MPLQRRKDKKRSPTYYRKKCVTWAKTEAKKRDGYICQHCGRSKDQGWQIHGSHILPEGTYVSMSADVDNIIALCATCHTGGWRGNKNTSWHNDPIYFAEWFNKKYPGKYSELRKRSQDIIVVNWENKWEEIK